MPVIFPVDCHKLDKKNHLGESVYSKNEYYPDRSVPENQPHVVVLMGYSPDLTHFVFHDSNVSPYMVANISDLANAGCMRDGELKVPDNGLFMPVTPDQVKMPLLWERRQDSDEEPEVPFIGLAQISDSFHKILGAKALWDQRRTRFILGQKLVAAKVHWLEAAKAELFSGTANRFLAELKVLKNWKADRWVWFEVCSDGVMVWDAELAPEEGATENFQQCCTYILGMLRLVQTASGEEMETLQMHLNGL